MKTHTSNFKNEVKKHGRQIDSIITYEQNGETIELGSEQFNSITPHYEGNILKSVMKQLDLDSKVEIPVGTELNYQFGVLINNSYEYLDFGNYIVKSVEKQEDKNSYKITCYDKMLYSMKSYETMNITYPITIREYLNAICTHLGLTFANDTDMFANYNREIPNELYLSYNETEEAYTNDMGYTFRDVLDEIAQATASTICINKDDELEVRYITETNDTINTEYLKNVNVKFGEKYGPVNSIVLSRSGESDNVYTQDTSSVELNGLCELKIIDNQIMNRNDRADYLPDLLLKLDGLEYYINDFSSTGICYYDVCDRYTINIDNNTYSCVMFNDEINVTQGLQENINTEAPDESETDYSKADKTDRKINQTYLIVDKQNQTISSVVSDVSDQNDKISQISQTVDTINSKISDISGITTQADSDIATVSLEGINSSEPVDIKIHPIGESISYLYPYDGLYPSNTLYLKNRVLRFTNTTTYIQTEDSIYLGDKQYFTKSGNVYTLLVAGTDYTIGSAISGTKYQHEIFDWELPTDLWYLNSEVYDEMELTYGDGTSLTKKVYVTRRCQINSSAVISQKTPTTTETYSYPSTLNLTTGDYTVTLLGYSNGYLLVQLMAANIYTTQFPTRVEMNSEIEQTASSITSSVSLTYATKDETTNTLNENSLASKITQTATSITNEVTRATTAEGRLDSRITQTADSITSEVTRATEEEGNLSSRIKQTATSISLTTSDNGTSCGIVIKLKNEDGTQLDSKTANITLSGLVKFTDLSGTGGSTVINGGNITTGTIDASQVTVANINASKINTGTLTAAAINLGNGKFRVTTRGTVTATSGTIGGWTLGSDSYGNKLGSDYVALRPNGNCYFYPHVTNGGIVSWDSEIRLKGPGGIGIYNSYTNYSQSTDIGPGIHIMADGGNLNLMQYSSSYGVNIRSYCSTQSQANASARSIMLAAANNITLSAIGGSVWANGNGKSVDRVKTDSGSASSKNTKTNIEVFNNKDYTEALELLKNIDIYSYDYKYKLYDKDHQYGFIIDDIEKQDNYSKFFDFSSSKARIRDDNSLDFSLEGITKEDKTIEVKKYNSDVLDKYLLTCIKALQNKIDKLEERLNG